MGKKIFTIFCWNFLFIYTCATGLFMPRRSRRDIVLASSVRSSIPSVRPHFLSVWNHISVPIGQIWFILGTNDKYHGLSISYKYGQNRPLNTCYCPCFSIGNYKAKPILAFLWNDLHISSKINFTLLDYDCPLPVDKHGSVKVLPHPLWPHLRGQRSNFAITKAIVNILCWNFAYRQSSNRYETY